MPISVVPMTKEEIKENEKRFPKKRGKKGKTPPGKTPSSKFKAAAKAGMVKRMAGGKTSK